MKYILIDDCGFDMFTKEFETEEEAVREGDSDFAYLNKADLKRRNAFYVLESCNPDPDAEDHIDGNIVKKWI